MWQIALKPTLYPPNHRVFFITLDFIICLSFTIELPILYCTLGSKIHQYLSPLTQTCKEGKSMMWQTALNPTSYLSKRDLFSTLDLIICPGFSIMLPILYSELGSKTQKYFSPLTQTCKKGKSMIWQTALNAASYLPQREFFVTLDLIIWPGFSIMLPILYSELGSKTQKYFSPLTQTYKNSGRRWVHTCFSLRRK